MISKEYQSSATFDNLNIYVVDFGMYGGHKREILCISREEVSI